MPTRGMIEWSWRLTSSWFWCEATVWWDKKKVAEKDNNKAETRIWWHCHRGREPQPNVINKKSEDEREESFQQNHEQRLEQAYERLRNRHSDISEIHRKDFANTTWLSKVFFLFFLDQSQNFRDWKSAAKDNADDEALNPPAWSFKVFAMSPFDGDPGCLG